MKMLLLDTSDSELTAFYLLGEKGLVAKYSWESRRSQAELLHEEVLKFLRKNKTSLQMLDKVGSIVGPGFFSRVRTGVVTANTLGYALNIPVVGVRKLGTGINFNSVAKQKGKTTVDVYYDRKPNITKSKKK
ncbi:MAG: tRNA (adenosine(37)-N6)-threonylcarbamoyltransferase complex dimerization subunit type 1 TsaB [Candidatus Doudnabacteria bacterium]|nr:tRNA (adenosine(37)-N6)-threonylcarbamoyltransferase complex dimerization subunit type 1 TsaB [Candidatus Doudnabacteria bacterium]